MRFEVGQAYECKADGRKALVSQVRDGGRSALLRFLDDGHEEWLLWVELHQAGQWHLCP